MTNRARTAIDPRPDGIEQLDHPPPSWWVGGMLVAVILAAGFFAYSHLRAGAPTLDEAYEASVARHLEAQVTRLGLDDADDATILRLASDAGMMSALGGLYRSNCGQCHADDGGGGIGPNLADQYWKVVTRPRDIYDVISNGVPGTAMVGWSGRLRRPQRILLAAYVASMRGRETAAPKAGEGAPLAPWMPGEQPPDATRSSNTHSRR